MLFRFISEWWHTSCGKSHHIISPASVRWESCFFLTATCCLSLMDDSETQTTQLCCNLCHCAKQKRDVDDKKRLSETMGNVFELVVR